MSIALNLLLNPNGAGGVETNARSLLAALDGEGGPFDVSLLVLGRYLDDWRRLMPHSKIFAWPHGQTVSNRHDPWQGARGLKAKLRQIYRASRYPESRVGRRPAIDRTLMRIGARAVHFSTSQVFETGLPFIYEPWDLQHLHLPAFFTPAEIARREAQYRWGCENARLVVTATHWTKNDIVDKYGIDPQKIVVAPRSSLVARRDLDEEQVDAELSAAGIGRPFIFYPAMAFEHKNHLRLFEALTILQERDGLAPDLVLSGRIHKPHWPKVEAAIEARGLGDRVKVLGSVSDNLLTALFRRARFMIFPSLFEGLGLPLLEAFHHGTPVIAADASCIPEVAGDAAWLFDGTNVEAMAHAIRRGLLEPEALAATAANAPRRLEIFSWKECAAVLAACYKTVLDLDLDEADRAALARGLA